MSAPKLTEAQAALLTRARVEGDIYSTSRPTSPEMEPLCEEGLLIGRPHLRAVGASQWRYEITSHGRQACDDYYAALRGDS